MHTAPAATRHNTKGRPQEVGGNRQLQASSIDYDHDSTFEQRLAALILLVLEIRDIALQLPACCCMWAPMRPCIIAEYGAAGKLGHARLLSRPMGIFSRRKRTSLRILLVREVDSPSMTWYSELQWRQVACRVMCECSSRVPRAGQSNAHRHRQLHSGASRSLG